MWYVHDSTDVSVLTIGNRSVVPSIWKDKFQMLFSRESLMRM